MSKLIVIRKSSISNNPTVLENWRIKNQSFLVLNPPNDADRFFLDLDLFFLNNGPNDWIKINGKHIIFDESKVAIEAIHTIKRSGTAIGYDDAMDVMVDGSQCDKLSFDDLVRTLNYKFDIKEYVDNTGKVRDYMILEMDANFKLKPAKFGPYDRTKTCYSFPFFCSIIENNKLNLNTPDPTKWVFYFVKLMIGNYMTVAFLIEFEDGTKKYYDYSHIPPGLFFIPQVRYVPSEFRDGLFSIGGAKAKFIKKDLQNIRRF